MKKLIFETKENLEIEIKNNMVYSDKLYFNPMYREEIMLALLINANLDFKTFSKFIIDSYTWSFEKFQIEFKKYLNYLRQNF